MQLPLPLDVHVDAYLSHTNFLMEYPCMGGREVGREGGERIKTSLHIPASNDYVCVPAGSVGRGSWGHTDAVDDGAHTDTQCAAGAVVSYVG